MCSAIKVLSCGEKKKNTIDFIYLDFPLGRVSVPLTPTLFKGQV